MRRDFRVVHGRVFPGRHNLPGRRGGRGQRGERAARTRRRGRRGHPPRRGTRSRRGSRAARPHRTWRGCHNRCARASEPLRRPHFGARLRTGPSGGRAPGGLLPQFTRTRRGERDRFHRLPRHLDRYLRLPGRGGSKVALETVRDEAERLERVLLVRFVLFGESDLEVHERVLSELE